MIDGAVDAHAPVQSKRCARIFRRYCWSFAAPRPDATGNICRFAPGRVNLRHPKPRDRMPTRILLAESDDVLRAGLAEQLAHEGYDVVTAADAQAVRDAMREPLNFAIIGLDDGEQL